MNISNNEDREKEAFISDDKITIKTGSSTYSFTQSWVENDALKDILAGLVADDLNRL